AALGVGVDTISFGGAAGGDRADYVTPRATVELLAAFAKRPDFAVYLEALPVLGVDGTLASAVGGESPAVDKFQAKTGTLLWANVMNDRYLLTSKALAGYGTSAGGKRLALTIFVNQVHIRHSTDRERIGRDLGKLCEIIYQSL
ncbi:MAG: D-alanyl-D-alanine carboxypeptidase, partial [Pirellulales bacterium]